MGNLLKVDVTDRIEDREFDENVVVGLELIGEEDTMEDLILMGKISEVEVVVDDKKGQSLIQVREAMSYKYELDGVASYKVTVN